MNASYLKSWVVHLIAGVLEEPRDIVHGRLVARRPNRAGGHAIHGVGGRDRLELALVLHDPGRRHRLSQGARIWSYGGRSRGAHRQGCDCGRDEKKHAWMLRHFCASFVMKVA